MATQPTPARFVFVLEGDGIMQGHVFHLDAEALKEHVRRQLERGHIRAGDLRRVATFIAKAEVGQVLTADNFTVVRASPDEWEG